MKKIFIIMLLNAFLSANLFAGCMKSEIKQIDAKLKSDNISVEKKVESCMTKNVGFDINSN